MINSKVVSLRILTLGDIHSYNSTHIRNIRAQMRLHHPDLILCAGDFPHDQQDISDFNFVSYFTPGNHDSMQSSVALNNLKYDRHFLCSNLKIGGFQAFRDDDLIIKKGIKIRIFGMTYSPEEEIHVRRKDHYVDPIQESIDNAVKRTGYLNHKYGGPDFTIGLTHIGVANDVLLANHLLSRTNTPKERLLIVGGHNHIINPRIETYHNTNIVHSGTNMQAFGIVDINFHENGKVNIQAINKPLVAYQTRPVPTEGINSDGSVMSDLKPERISAKNMIILDNKEEYDDIYAPYNIDYAALDYHSNNELGTFFTKRLSEITGSDVVLINGGTFREPLDKRYSPQNAAITAKKIFPFTENQIITFKANAKQIKAILQKEVALLNKTAGEYNIGTLNNKLYFQVAGIRYTVIKEKDGKYTLGEVSFNDPDKTNYKVATVDFLWYAYAMEDIIGVNNYHISGSATNFMEEVLRLDDLSVPPGIHEIKRIIPLQ